MRNIKKKNSKKLNHSQYLSIDPLNSHKQIISYTTLNFATRIKNILQQELSQYCAMLQNGVFCRNNKIHLID